MIAMRSLLTTLLLLVMLAAAPARGQADLSWFEGAWTVSYTDGVLGAVRGHALVSRAPGEGAVRVMVTLVHPETEERFHLRSRSVKFNGRQLEVVLHGPSPSGPVSGTPRAAGGFKELLGPGQFPGEGRVELTVPPGAMLRARVDGGEGEAATLDGGQSVGHDLRLVCDVGSDRDMLDWRWRYDYPRYAEGFRGRRVGSLIDNGATAIGAETWTRSSAQSIVSVEDLRQYEAATTGDAIPAVDALVRVRGWELPIDSAEALAVAFEDPMVEFVRIERVQAGRAAAGGAGTRAPDEMDLRVRLIAGVRGGPKPFTLAGIPGVWDLRAAASLPAVRFLQRLPDGTERPAHALCHGDVFRVEVVFDDELPFEQRLVSLIAGERTHGPLVVERDKDEPERHVSPWLVVMDLSAAAPMEVADALPVAALPGQAIVLEAADLLEPMEWAAIDVLPADARTEPAVIIRPDTWWQADASIRHVLPDQLFYVMLRVPAAKAEQLGDEATVELVVEEGGDREKVLLRRHGGRPGAPVAYYASVDPLTVARGPHSFVEDVFPLPGAFLSVSDGGAVTARFETAATTFHVHDNAMRRRERVRRQQVEQLLRGLQLVRGDTPPADVWLVDAKILMAQNALTIAARPELAAYERAAVLESYLVLLQRDIDQRSLLTGRTHPVYGVTLACMEESQAIAYAMEVEAARILRDGFNHLARDLSIGMYEFVVTQTGVGGYYTAVSGRTLTGKPVNWLGRVLAALDSYQNVMNNFLTSKWGNQRHAEEWMNKLDGRRRSAANKRAGDAAGATPDPAINGVAAAADVADAASPGSLRRKAFQERIENGLKRLDIGDDQARAMAEEIMRAHPDMPPHLAVVAAAADAKIPPSALIARGGYTAEELADHLDDYYRRYVGVDDPARRRRMIDQYMGAHAPISLDSADSWSSSTMRPDAGEATTILSDLDDPSHLRRIEAAQEEAYNNFNRAFRRAEFAHNGRGLMDELFDAELELTRRLLPERGLTAEQIQQKLAQMRASQTRLHGMADRVEAVLGRRRQADYAGLKLFGRQGCTDDEAVIGHLFMNSNAGASHVRGTLGMADDQIRGALDGFLQKSQRIEDAAQRRRIIDGFLGS